MLISKKVIFRYEAGNSLAQFWDSSHYYGTTRHLIMTWDTGATGITLKGKNLLSGRANVFSSQSTVPLALLKAVKLIYVSVKGFGKLKNFREKSGIIKWRISGNPDDDLTEKISSQTD